MMQQCASYLCRGIEVVITGLTRNQFASNRTRVRIPPSAPINKRSVFADLLFIFTVGRSRTLHRKVRGFAYAKRICVASSIQHRIKPMRNDNCKFTTSSIPLPLRQRFNLTLSGWIEPFFFLRIGRGYSPSGTHLYFKCKF